MTGAQTALPSPRGIHRFTGVPPRPHRVARHSLQSIAMAAPLLILASASPRRALLLREAGLAFVQMQPPFVDPPQPQHDHDRGPVDAAALTTALARAKALSLREAGVLTQHPGAVILAADTVCVDQGRPIGQPADADAARGMIRAMRDHTHAVVTGVALLRGDDRDPFLLADEARVAVGFISEAEIESYVRSQQWRGKAGGYNLFDRQAAGWPLGVEGDPATVVGLPMRKLLPLLRQRGITSARPSPARPTLSP